MVKKAWLFLIIVAVLYLICTLVLPLFNNKHIIPISKSTIQSLEKERYTSTEEAVDTVNSRLFKKNKHIQGITAGGGEVTTNITKYSTTNNDVYSSVFFVKKEKTHHYKVKIGHTNVKLNKNKLQHWTEHFNNQTFNCYYGLTKQIERKTHDYNEFTISTITQDGKYSLAVGRP